MSDGTDRVGEAIAAWAEMTAPPDPSTGARSRPMRPVRDGAVVELREITEPIVRDVLRLQVAPSQRGHVAPNAVSLAEALFEPKAWYRVIVADDRPVGFAMLSVDTAKPEYYLWRLMVAEPYQGLGYGRRAVELLVEHVRGLPNATELVVSWVPGEAGPERFYRDLGFEPTGEVDEGEVVARLTL